MPIQFDQTTAGVVTLQAPASGSYTLQLPSGNGSSNQYLISDGAGGLSWGDLTGLTGSVAALNTASPNNTVNVSSFSASGGTTDVFFALTTSANGGTVQAQVADSTATGGNSRGSFAFDFQMQRTSASQVASGAYSSVVGGASNTASGSSSTVVGGLSNNSSTSYSFIGGGQSNTVSAASGVILGGYANTISSTYSNSVILGGRANTTDQDYQAILGGYAGSCNGTPALTVLPTANPIGASTTNAFIGAGYAKYYWYDSNANSTLATLNGVNTASSTNQIKLRTNSVYSISFQQVMYEFYFPIAAARSGYILLRRGGAASTTTIVSGGGKSSLTYKSGINDTLTSSSTADTTYGAFSLYCVGSVGHVAYGSVRVTFQYIEY